MALDAPPLLPDAVPPAAVVEPVVSLLEPDEPEEPASAVVEPAVEPDVSDEAPEELEEPASAVVEPDVPLVPDEAWFCMPAALKPLM